LKPEKPRRACAGGKKTREERPSGKNLGSNDEEEQIGKQEGINTSE